MLLAWRSPTGWPAGTEDDKREPPTGAIGTAITAINAVFDPFAQGPQPADPPEPPALSNE